MKKEREGIVFGLLTEEEKQELRNAKTLQVFDINGKWFDASNITCPPNPAVAYRIKPTKMICPIEKTCSKKLKYLLFPSLGKCAHDIPHDYDDTCDRETSICPTCVPHEEPKKSTFNLGDYVISNENDRDGLKKGNVYKIVTICQYTGCLQLEGIGNEQNRTWFAIDHFTLCEGQSVICNKFAKNECVWLDSGCIHRTPHEQRSNCHGCKPIKDLTKKPTSKFKIGDMVRCINNKGFQDTLKIGEIYKVIDYKGFLMVGFNIKINTKSLDIWCDSSYFELIETPPKYNFPEGFRFEEIKKNRLGTLCYEISGNFRLSINQALENPDFAGFGYIDGKNNIIINGASVLYQNPNPDNGTLDLFRRGSNWKPVRPNWIVFSK